MRATGRGGRLRWMLPVLIASIVLGGIEGLSAIALHFFFPKPEVPEGLRASLLQGDRAVPTLPAPYLGFRVRPNYRSQAITTNRLGLRNDEIDEIPAPGTFRVLLLGGSVAWSHTALSNREALSTLIESELTMRSREVSVLQRQRIEVLNAAVPAYVAWQSALAYSIDRHRLEPRVVISLDGVNDASAALRAQFAGAAIRYARQRDAYLDRTPTFYGGLRQWITYRSARLKTTRLVRRRWPVGIADRDLPSPEDVAHEYVRAIEHLGDFAKLEGALAMAVFQPMNVLGEKPATDFETRVESYHETSLPGRRAFHRAYAENVRREFARLEVEARPELLLFDASRAFSEVEDIVFVDPAHLTQQAREILASAIVDRLIGRLRKVDAREH